MATKSDGLAIVALLVSATLWGVIWFPMRWFQQQGVSGLWSSLIMYGALIPLGLWVARHQLHQFGRQWRALVWIALASGWTNVAFIVAVIDGNVVRVLLLFYLSPAWAILFAWWTIGERPDTQAALTALVALVGALVMLWDPALDYPWPHEANDWLALSAGMGFAIANVALRASPQLALPMKMLANWVGVALVAGAWVVWSAAAVPSITLPTLALALLMGVVMLVMTLTVQYGVSQLPIYRSSVILLFELVAGAVSAQLLTDEAIQALEWLGGALIIGAAYLSARAQRQASAHV